MRSRPLLMLAAVAAGVLPWIAAGPSWAAEIAVIPKPASVKPAEGHFAVTAKTALLTDVPGDEARDAVACLTERLKAAVGVELKAQAVSAATTPKDAILLTTRDADAALGDEGYTLNVTPDHVVVRATKAAGLFYGVQTLLQMMPPTVFASPGTPGPVLDVPCATVTDKPRFAWRGLHFDVSRHFFPKAEVLRLIDQMALHKLNVLHWHLTDDQGWRIEIKKYPKLTEIGAWRDSAGFAMDPKLSTTYRADGKYGGFYTQDEIKEVVAYAAARQILVVPEIEMPGHATAALRAYPEIGTPAPPSKEVKGDAGIFNGVFEPSNPKTFEFLQDVLAEVIELFPSPYIHIGGDETPKGPWENNQPTVAFMKANNLTDGEHLQSYFVKKIDAYITSKGRRMLGWDEILEGGLAPGATVMSWRGTKGGIAAAKSGHDVVMTPTTHCYLDGEQGIDTEPHERGALLTAAKCYSYEPVPAELSAEQAKHVLGVQGNLWTEYVPNFAWAEYLYWPRGAALAEVGWTAAADRQWPDFERRLAAHVKRLDALGVNYRPAETDTLGGAITLKDGKLTIANPTGATVRYTLDGTWPSETSPEYTGPVALPGGWVQATARYFTPGKTATPAAAAQFLFGRPVTLACTSPRDYETRHQVFYTPRWGGGPRESVTVTFDDGPADVKAVTVRSGTAEKPETKVKDGNAVLESSTDGKTFTPAAEFKDGVAHADLAGKPVAAFRVQYRVQQLPHPILETVTLE